MNTIVKKNIILKYFSFFLQIFSSFYLLKLFVSSLGAEVTADWLVILSLLALVNLSDFGVVEAYSNEYVLNKDSSGRKKQILSTGFFYLIVLYIIMVLMVFLISLIPVNVSLITFKTSIENQKIIILFLVITIGLFVNLTKFSFSTFRALNQSHIQFFIEVILQLSEIIIIIFFIRQELSLTLLLCAILFLRVSFFIFINAIFNDKFREAISYSNVSIRLVKDLLPQSFSFLSQPLSYALLNVVSILLVSEFYSSLNVIIYSSSRTLVSGYKSIYGAINTAIAPIITYIGKESMSTFSNFRRIYIISSLTFTSFLILVFLFFGERLFELWFEDVRYYSKSLILCGFISLYFWIFWYMDSLFLNAVNRNKLFSIYFLLTSILFVFLLFLFGFFKGNFYMINIILIFVEVILLVLTNLEFRKQRESLKE